MSFTSWLFSRDKAPAEPPIKANSRIAFPASQTSSGSAESPQAVRKELVRLVLRETLKHNGLALNWITSDALVAMSSRREPGIHVRLVMKHWDARLPEYTMAFQQHFETRLLTMDPLASTWLMGISWQYDLPPDAHWPSLPSPATWAAIPAEVPDESMIPQATVLSIRTRAELERDMADEDQRFRVSGTDFAPTEAGAYSLTQPAPLR